jgi:hypothetical protein
MKTCKTVCDLSLIEKYESILSLEKSEKPKQLKIKTKKEFKKELKVWVVVIKEVHGMKVGSRILLKASLAKILVDSETVKYA